MSEDVTAPPRPDAIAPDAIARYNRRMRPWRIAYAAGIVVVVVVALVLVKIAYNHGELSHTTLHTAPKAPPSIALGSPPSTLGVAWTSADTTAIGVPFAGGTIVTHDAHTVRGRDARTGKQTWSYTRTDRTVCAAMQDNGTAVAVYKLHGNCDELTALDAQTGARQWTRTLDEDTGVFDGPASFQVQSGNLFFVTHTSIYSIADGGIDYWRFHHTGCTINGAVLGVGGALISQTCANESCPGKSADNKLCGDGPQLLLRDATASYDSDNHPDNPDRITWNDLGSTLQPVLAGRNIGALDSSGRLHLLSAAKGAALATLTLPHMAASSVTTAPGGSTPPAALSYTDDDALWLAGRLYAIGSTQHDVRWSVPASSPPTDCSTTGLASGLSRATLCVATADGVAFLDGATGKQSSGYPTGASPAGTRAYRFGSGFVLAGPRTTVLS